VGWFARDAEMLERVGHVLLSGQSPALPQRFLIAQDAFALVDRPVANAVRGAIDAVAQFVPRVEEVTVSPAGLKSWMETFRVVQGSEIWANHGQWIESTKPHIGPAIAERLALASRLDPKDIVDKKAEHAAVAAHLDALLGEGDVLCLPSSPRIAPLRGTEQHELEVVYRYQAMCLLCIAGLGGLPQISLPLATLDGCPLGVSLVGRRGADEMLLQLSRLVMEAL
jgi:amidase